MRKFKETKKQFDKVREDLELSLVRNAQAPRHRPHEVEEATGALTLTRKCFRHLALDYVLQINVLQAKKKFEILDSMLSFMHAQSSFFQQGYSLLHQLDPYMKKLAAELDQLVIDSAVEKREMERKHAAIQQRVRPRSRLPPHPTPGTPSPPLPPCLSPTCPAHTFSRGPRLLPFDACSGGARVGGAAAGISFLCGRGHLCGLSHWLPAGPLLACGTAAPATTQSRCWLQAGVAILG